MIKKRILILIVILTIISVVTGCAPMLENLRRDLNGPQQDQGPTVGGMWPEGGYLSDGAYGGRNPAGEGSTEPGMGQSWVTPDHASANQRDMYRGGGYDEQGNPTTSYSDTQTLAPPVKRLYKNGIRATRADFIDEAPNEGSLWASDGQTNYYFTKNRIRSVGDIITINVEQDLYRDTLAEVTRTLSPIEKDAEMMAAQERLIAKANGADEAGKQNADAVRTSAASAQRTPAGQGQSAGQQQTDVPMATPADIDLSKSLEFKEGDKMMAEIVDRFPNGNYKIRGTKRLRYRNGTRYMNVVGVVRGADIAEDDTLNSGRLYEYRLEVIR